MTVSLRTLTASVLVCAGASAAGAATAAAQPSRAEIARWTREAQNVTIVRDDWGIAHVYGHSDADAVFGMIYAQAEDDFNRVETNYINAMGRLAEAEGEGEVWRDLRMKLFIDPDSMKATYARSPRWLQSLMVAFADGLNYYLYKHPNVKPRVIRQFEPWMALTFSEGSIGGDIERVNLDALRAFYDSAAPSAAMRTSSAADKDGPPPEPSGSNGIAIAPSNTVNHHALLLINPHTSFYFRSELQMVSDSGLNAYGAVTWGQFFVYQGFNDRAGWMHTSSGVDAIDEYAETVTKTGSRYTYRYDTKDLPVRSKRITVPYRTPSGLARRTFTVYYTQHGPVVRSANGKWMTIRLMQEPLKALTQSYLRTKARSYDAFDRTMELHTNSSNNTIYADADGTIAYFHGNFIPRRDTSFDWTKPVDGSDPRTDWHGLLSVDETPHLKNPPNGWLYNSNNWPWSAAGPYSPKRADFPRYVEQGGESFRGLHAIRVLQGRRDFSVPALMAAAYDSYLPAFEQLLPPLIHAWDATPPTDSLSSSLAAQIGELRRWDYRWGAASVPTSLAVYWATDMLHEVRRDAAQAGMSGEDYIVQRATAHDLLAALARASDKLTADFGSWRTPWGAINRFQRLNDNIEPSFDDAKPSIPVPFTSSRWGSLASFGARPYPNTKKWYGTSGNSFVAVVEFGDSVHAVAVTAGGESGHPDSPHFDDEAARYAAGNLRPVYFYRSQLHGHTEREYHPGA